MEGTARARLALTLVVLAVLVSGSVARAAEERSAAVRILVRFDPAASVGERAGALLAIGGRVQSELPARRPRR